MHYAPEGVPPAQMNTETMWFIYGYIAMVSEYWIVFARELDTERFRKLKHVESINFNIKILEDITNGKKKF
ncbi:MAG: hypothetical protein IPI19_10965 [Ignavibacteriales bacterium]|nr:hypothetical protein [Ignavibacteriales bacterium]